ncbi:Trk system potassium uptake protein TrkA [Poriferisphaera corsica]|uniref:Trk system potassium uptake protein TrkA n=1 Tax=Poriferisphaera corsica TaxID=2528020 RepID=A0A517YW22_9BACT|nr:Trk system potassium transporter TrkA [Poriferisphaera corsica]QDU34427.1 Trk system potassium uptake protein TrkA [Poriferisphaera corsica]
MNIVICGAGEVGRHSAEVLAKARNNITVIDQSPEKLAELDDVMDVRSLLGNATQADILLEAGTAKADLFIAATSSDEINLLAASIAKGVGATTCIARVHHSAFFEQNSFAYAKHLGVDHMVCPEYATAHAIASTLRNPGALAVEQFAKGKVEMQQLPVSEDSKAAGLKLRDIQLPGAARVAAVEHFGYPSIPDADTVIEAHDILTIIGDTNSFEKIRKVFQTTTDKRRRIIIMGGTGQSVWLCRVLKHRGFSIRLFETDRARAEELSEKLDWVTVLNADAVNTDALKDERVDLADAFVAMTDDEETNILAAARAKSMGVAQAIAVLQRPTYLHLLRHIGIDKAFSPRSTAVTEIQRLIEPGPVKRLGSLSEGIAEIYEIKVPGDASKVIGKPLSEIKFPGHCLLAALQRDKEVFVPGADSVIMEGDTVIAVGPASSKSELRRLFGAKGLPIPGTKWMGTFLS